MWTIFEERKIEKQLDKAPKEIVEAYEFWKNMAATQGPQGLQNFPGFRDHSLKGQWAGARSSYLNRQWRVIYVVKGNALEILVLEVNAHDYRKKG